MKRVFQTDNGQTLTVVVAEDGSVTLRIAKDGHNRGVAKLSAATWTEVRKRVAARSAAWPAKCFKHLKFGVCVMPSFSNITDIKRANKAAGYFWFSPDTVRLFKPRVLTRVYDAGTGLDYPQGSKLWVESTSDGNGGREFKVCRFNVAMADISYVSADYRTLRFATKSAAVECLEGLL